MTTHRIIPRLAAASLAITAFAATAITADPAKAQEGVAIKNLLGSMGVIPAEKDPIRYRERAPLVLPPKMQLREPGATGRTASTDPAWPRDADAESKRRVADEQRRPVTESEVRRMAERNTRLTPEEMRTGRVAELTESTTVDPSRHRGDNARDVLLLTPEQLAAGRKAAEPETTGAEPQRRTLAEPPSGFRKPVTGPLTAAVGTPKIDQQERDASPMNWLTRKFSGASEED